MTRVTRIHNRFLRNRFDEKLEHLVNVANEQYKKKLEYLFYGTDPKNPSEMLRAIEEGFRSSEEYQREGLAPFIPLVNNMTSADLPRVKEFLSTENGKALLRAAAKESRKRRKGHLLENCEEMGFSRGLVAIPTGQILVCKVYLGECILDSVRPHFDFSCTSSEIWQQEPINPAIMEKMSEIYENKKQVLTIYRMQEEDNKQRMWFVFDNSLVLPEYVIEFEYLTGDFEGVLAEEESVEGKEGQKKEAKDSESSGDPKEKADGV